MGLILYSTNTWLAYKISERYYNDEHYIWCTPDFSQDGLPRLGAATPPTSTPQIIYRNLFEEVKAGDRHSVKIEQNKIGLINSAQIKKTTGIISDEQEAEIISIVNQAEVRDFRPLLYLIPYESARHLLTAVPVAERAHPLSLEYRILSLPRDLFEIIEL